MEYLWIAVGSRDIKVKNGVGVEVLGINTYKLDLRGGHTLLLHNVLYVTKIWHKFLFVATLLKLGF